MTGEEVSRTVSAFGLVGSVVPIAGAGKAGKFVGKAFLLGAEFIAKNPEIFGKKVLDRNINRIQNEAPDFIKKLWSETFDDIKHLPPLRQKYIKEVRGLKRAVNKLYREGKTSEEVARTVSQMRRDIGIKYKEMTPPELLDEIHKRNIVRYDDKLGPTIEWYRSRGFSWEEIIEKACREGGDDIKFDKK